eukprot:jgi/Picre1/28546/NNA_003948.t1
MVFSCAVACGDSWMSTYSYTIAWIGSVDGISVGRLNLMGTRLMLWLEKVSLPEKEKGTEGEPSPKTLQKDGEKKGH